MSLALAQQQQSKPITLKVTAGPNKGAEYIVRAPGAVLGRDPETCQIIFTDPKISRKHCQIQIYPHGITVKDLAEKGTTYVNDKSVEYVSLQNKDIIKLADTFIQVQMEEAPKDSLQGKVSGGGSTHKPGFNLKEFMTPPRIIMLLVLIGLAWLVLSPTKKKDPPPSVVTNEEKEKAIDTIVERQNELKAPSKKLNYEQRFSKAKSEEYFIRGFRDYQNGRYTRSITAFQTAIAANPKHIKARRYYSLAKKKRRDLASYHMDLGGKYKSKIMYRFCMAEFEKVLQIINQPRDTTYRLAKEQFEECRLSLQRAPQ